MSNRPTTKESAPIQEYVIRVTPKTNKKYNVMRFSEADSIDFNKWKNVKLDREFNLKEYKSSNANDEDAPKFGAGSVFGAEQREESRKKRYLKYASRHRAEDQPWILNVKLNKSQQPTSTIQNGNSNIKQSSSRKFKGIREGGVTDNTSYYVFFQAHDGAFEAFPVSEWYKFSPIPKFKALTAEEAEEQFLKRDKILNFFTVMDTKKKNEFNDSAEDGQFGFKSRRTKKDFKTSDMDDWGDFGGMSDGSGQDSGDDNGKGKKKGKKRDSDDNDSEAKEESDEGDFDQREVDYMSDESSSDDEAEVERLNKELQGVEDEDALRQLVLSDEESEEEENKSNAKDNKETPEQLKQQANDKKSIETTDVKIKKEKKANNSDSSDSDSSDLDEKNFQSSIFLQKNENKSAIKKESKNENSQQTNAATALKRKLETSTDSPMASTSSSQASNPAKRPKVVNAETSLEETVKRYLMRKPITTTELIKNVKKMKVTNSKEDLVAVISQILKKLNPQTQKISDKLYLYLNPKTVKL